MSASSASVERATAKERAAGLTLMVAGAMALAIANSPLGTSYERVLSSYVGPLTVDHWIADGLMAVFFLLVGLEVKREWFVGQLATASARKVPMIAAAAGMAVPALLYLLVIGFDPDLSVGWAIPAATDIAFALGILALIGARAPASIKLLLVTIAIIDDVGAVAIIALFYTDHLNFIALIFAAVIAGCMFAMNARGIRPLWPYLFGFVLLWSAVLLSGVHATLAGILTALAIPLGSSEMESPLRKLEHAIHPAVMFGVVPLFGFASAGVRIDSLGAVLQPLPLGIAVGLFVGKQLGVFGSIWLADKTGIAKKPAHLRWKHIYGAAALTGVGFTMSLFIGNLAFDDSEAVDAAKIGTLTGSLLSAIVGYMILRITRPIPTTEAETDEAAELFAEDYTGRH